MRNIPESGIWSGGREGGGVWDVGSEETGSEGCGMCGVGKRGGGGLYIPCTKTAGGEGGWLFVAMEPPGEGRGGEEEKGVEKRNKVEDG